MEFLNAKNLLFSSPGLIVKLIVAKDSSELREKCCCDSAYKLPHVDEKYKKEDTEKRVECR